jgi:hypothetical protein
MQSICYSTLFEPVSTLTEEDIEMTFQVALVGSNGIVVASDRKVTYQTRERSTLPWDRQISVDRKYVCKDDDSIVCFFAGGSQSLSIANAVICRADASLKNVSDWHSELQKAADSVVAKSTGDEVMVIRPFVGDVALINRFASDATVSPIPDRRCTGVIAKCRFLTQLFWRESTVSELRRLALILLHFASTERPESVGDGYDLLVVENGKVKWEKEKPLDSEEVQELVLKFSRAIDQSIFSPA